MGKLISKSDLIITPKKFGDYLQRKHFPLWVAINHHKTHTNKNMTFKHHHYLKEILTDTSRHRVLKKSTQGGVSECLIVISWSFAYDGKVVFYVLPTDGLKGRFVTNRFEKSMSFSSYYRAQRKLGKSREFGRDLIDNQSLKDIGEGVINFAGSKSDVPFIEIPADVLLVDEADACDAKRLEMGKERLGHSADPYEIYVGNPTFLGSFLDEKYNESTQSRWHIKHDCGHWINIDFFEHVVRQEEENIYVIRDKDYELGSGDIQPICDKCYKPFDRFSYGTYVPAKKHFRDGKHISRIFSGSSSIYELVENFSKALEDPYKMQRFYNSDLGESYTAEGAKITRGLLEECKGEFLMPQISKESCVMGVDVGNVLHVRINKILPDKRKQAMFIGTVAELSDLFSLCKRYHVVASVIDALPEIRMARQFSHSESGYFRCFFGSDKNDTINIKEKTITVSRTMSMDSMKESFALKHILLPKDILNHEEYLTQMTEPTRTWDEDREEYVWISNRDDHFFLAETYCYLAEKVLKFIK